MNRGEIVPPVNDVVHVLLADRVARMMRKKPGIDRSGDVVDVVLGRPVIGRFVHPVVDPICSCGSHCILDLADKRIVDQKVQIRLAGPAPRVVLVPFGKFLVLCSACNLD